MDHWPDGERRDRPWALISEDGRARLTDFGIAQPKDDTALTQTGRVVGTLSYLAPEARRGERATPRSDLYSLGVVLREAGGERDRHATQPFGQGAAGWRTATTAAPPINAQRL